MSFEDHEFPAGPAAIGSEAMKDMKQNLSWCRPREIADRPVFISDGVNPGDVMQGQLGDCWFLGGLSVMATRPDLLRQVLPVDQSLSDGSCTFRIHKFGEWHDVRVDDKIPVTQRGPVFCSSKDPNEMWTPLIEKAYAKVHRTYSALIGGWVTDALSDLTGGVPQTIEFDSIKEDVSSGQFFNTLLHRYSTGSYLMGCARATGGAREVDVSGQGILAGHAYGILQVANVDGHRLIMCRNPWGSHEWTGKWSDKDSASWTPAMKERLHHVNAEDGAFWIAYEDFIHQYTKVYSCRLFDTSWSRVFFKTAWSGENAGGCCNHASWKNNAQYIINVPTRTEVVISLQVRDPRVVGNRDDLYIGFVVFQSDGGKVDRYRKPVITTDIADNRDVSAEAILEPGTYALLPFTFDPRVEAEYFVSIFTKNPVSVKSTLGVQAVNYNPPPPAPPSVQPPVHDDSGAAHSGVGAPPVVGGTDDGRHEVEPEPQRPKKRVFDDFGNVSKIVQQMAERLRGQYPALRNLNAGEVAHHAADLISQFSPEAGRAVERASQSCCVLS